MSSIAPMHGPSQVIQRNIAMNICFSMMEVSTFRFSFFRLSFGGVGCLVLVVLDESQILLLCCYSIQTGGSCKSFNTKISLSQQKFSYSFKY
jgi:hypothetical protein